MNRPAEQTNPFDECSGSRPNSYFGLPGQSEKGIVGDLRENVSNKIKDLLSMFQASTGTESTEGFLDRI